MTRRIRPAKVHDGFQKFLRPGALARIRDSRMIRPRSANTVAAILLPLPSSPVLEESVVGIVVVPQVPTLDVLSGFFAGRSSGPRFVQRKKLVASKAIVFKTPAVAAVDLEGANG